MKIAVLIKEVPDTYGERRVDLATGLVDRSVAGPILDDTSERALEVALQHAAAAPGVEISIVTMAPAGSGGTLRRALAMGADDAIHIVDDDLAGADLTLTAEVLGAAVRAGGFDLVIGGNSSTDGGTGVLPAMLAEVLDWPQLTWLDDIQIHDDRVSGLRATDGGTFRVSATLPAVASVTERVAEPRLPTFKGIMSAKKKPISTLGLADLGIAVAPEAPRSIVINIAERPPRSAGVKVVDSGSGGTDLAGYLTRNGLV
jgi:electron transfer flavoprotein beta subunit